ncbi:metal-dependent hydrolase [Paenibacillus polysaccharolyticus]|uniref:metal-dependent hydrolase n=1 Tax=Paenibacillus polysaccharolyticus TaxID=582692 RepID=UPI00209C8076|nr:metal-dependent hydrolase [Paenibacillus polysaccharolyticus]MCP1133313.1 metal-dependent hydrolase [Paenibacillus polysaccharolyticus]
MNGVSHLIGGLSAAVIFGVHSPSQLAMVAFSALLPDIDRPNSLLGRFVPVLPSILEKIPGKRTVTHSLIMGFGLWLLLEGTFPELAIAFLIGYVSHLILDLFTGYIAFLWPIPWKVGVPLFGIPPVFVETAAIALWGVWMVLDGYTYFLNLF